MGAPVMVLTDAGMDVHASPGHPERPERRVAVADGVRDAAGDALLEPAVGPADDAALALVHDPLYLALLSGADERGGWFDADTYLVPGSLRAARMAAGAARAAALAVAEGEAEVAFAVVRPPGHHAAAERGSGFCLVNNVAVAAAGLRAAGRAQRIAIVDWDVHHGDGTASIFGADADVCYASTHQSPLYPGTGLRSRGTMHNHPLPPGAGDEEFVAAWSDHLLPAVEAFEPEAILVSAGFDAHRADPLAQLEVTEAGFGEVARLLGAVSQRLELPGVALALEGGYDLDALRASASATVRGLLAGRHAAADAR